MCSRFYFLYAKYNFDFVFWEMMIRRCSRDSSVLFLFFKLIFIVR